MIQIAFDMDGTLYDCGDIVAESFQRGIINFNSIKNSSLRIPTREEILSVVGIPTDMIFRTLFQGLSDSDYVEINRICMDELATDVREKKGYLYEGIDFLIESLYLKGYSLVIASNGTEVYLKAILDTYGLEKYFEPMVILDNEKVKTKVDIVRIYRERLSDSDLLLMVGDRHSDREAAEKNDVPFLACAYGHCESDEIEGVRWVVQCVNELESTIEDIIREVNLLCAR